MLTREEVQAALPKHLRSAATQELTDTLNNIQVDPEIAEHIRTNFISYSSVLKEGKFKVSNYMEAVAYVSFKLMGYTNQEAYSRTFPDRIKKLRADGRSAKDISAYVAIYNKGKLVSAIMQQTVIPTWVMNQDKVQLAVDKLAEVIQDEDVSARTQVEAANSLLSHLKRPETKQVELDIGIKESEGLSELRTMLENLATTQQSLIENGVQTKAVAHQKLGGQLIDVTPEAVEK